VGQPHTRTHSRGSSHHPATDRASAGRPAVAPRLTPPFLLLDNRRPAFRPPAAEPRPRRAGGWGVGRHRRRSRERADPVETRRAAARALEPSPVSLPPWASRGAPRFGGAARVARLQTGRGGSRPAPAASAHLPRPASEGWTNDAAAAPPGSRGRIGLSSTTLSAACASPSAAAPSAASAPLRARYALPRSTPPLRTCDLVSNGQVEQAPWPRLQYPCIPRTGRSGGNDWLDFLAKQSMNDLLTAACGSGGL
jgi:hypothetical protein